jgi:hypothetical protein
MEFPMRIERTLPVILLAAAAVLASSPAEAQGHEHVEGMTHSDAAMADAPVSAGQAAYGAIAEVVARLDADPATDWSKVNVETLRRHLIDMDLVTMRSRVVSRNIPGGFSVEVTGDGAAVGAIRGMTAAHARQLAREEAVSAEVSEIPGGVRMSVTSTDPADAKSVARLRGLGFAGVKTLGNHHGPHHEMLARGASVHGK